MEELNNRRHSLSHLLASAVLKLYPEAKPTLGPAIDTGFYYDFGNLKIGDEDLKKIEKEMKIQLKNWKEFTYQEVTKEEATERYKDNKYKLELINEFTEKGEKITFYTSGGFTDLCRGGHADDLSSIDKDSFSLDKTAGAYWRGDEKNDMLTRIYGLAFETKEELEEHLKMKKEALERDHRKLGKELDLFTFSEKVGAGLPMFTPKGTALRNAIVNKIYEIQSEYSFEEVCIPHITKPELYKTSGHWEKFGDELFKVKGQESDFVIKPMNCPHHTQIFASSPKSYKNLPVRFVEATTVYRDEQSGELLGLSRVRSITQDDGHTFCTPEQIGEEIGIIVDVIKKFYTELGMFNENTYRVALSTRDKNAPEKYLGDDEIWNKSEEVLKEIAEKEKLNYTIAEGDAAFYGPKLDFMFKDALGREWQLATVQLDFNMPKRFDLEYIDKDGSKKTPVMIHRAIAGSLERFMSVIIEHFAGAFPYWLSPIQVKVLSVSEKHKDYAEEIVKKLKAQKIRVEIDESDEGLGKKVRKAKIEKVPYFVIIGDKEMEVKKVTLESRDEGQVGLVSFEELLENLK
jgi:threonyl-tRNA synthetase